MKLTYQELPEYQFPHWITWEVNLPHDDLNHVMDVNEWCGSHFGDLGGSWGYERTQDTSRAPSALNPIRVRLYWTTVRYSWRFKEGHDALLFKLTWGGA